MLLERYEFRRTDDEPRRPGIRTDHGVIAVNRRGVARTHAEKPISAPQKPKEPSPINLKLSHQTLKLLRKHILRKEDAAGVGAPVNNVSSGNIAGVGVGAQGEPGINPKRKKHDVERRKTPGILSRKISLKPKKIMLP